MKSRKRNTAKAIMADLDGLAVALESGVPLRQKYTVRTVRLVPDPGKYDAVRVKGTRALVGVSQPVFAQMLGVSPALVRSWECGQRTPAPIARRLLDLIRASPGTWRAMVQAA